MLAAARSLMIERGSEDFTLQEVGTRGKVSIGSIYLRFESKDNLVRAVLARGLADLAAAEAAMYAQLLAASARLQQSQAQLADLDKGQRRDELAVLEAQLAATRASEALAHRDLLRQQQLARQGVVSVATLDSYRAR
jgi:AcrR family transcriptional regulator